MRRQPTIHQPVTEDRIFGVFVWKGKASNTVPASVLIRRVYQKTAASPIRVSSETLSRDSRTKAGRRQPLP